MTTETIHRVPLAKLLLAPENARYNSKALGDIPALGASIVAIGDLIEPLKAYADGDDFRVWDGGRRLAALMKLESFPKTQLPPALAAGVPVIVTSKATAALHSRATFVREGLDAAEEFANYKALLDAGLQPEAIAAACAVATPRVKQLLRLCDVAPEILKAFAAHKIALDVVEAFTLSADPAKQLEVWKSFKGGTVSAQQVKSALRKGAIGADDRIARFVGRDVYEAAGGVFLQDLFTGRDDEAWADGALAKKLAETKIAELIAKHQAEGWSWVKFASYEDYYYDRGLKQLPKPPGGKWSKESMDSAGVVLKMQHNGQIDVQRGWTSQAKAKQAAGVAPAEKKPAQADPERFGYSHVGHHTLTLVATEAVRVGLMRKPETAYDAMLTHLAWLAFGPEYGKTDSTASKLTAPHRYGPLAGHVDGGKELEALHGLWKNRLHPVAKAGRVAFCEAVAALKPKEKSELLALCFGATLDCIEGRIDGRQPSRWAHLGWIAAKAGVDPAKAWTPDADFLKGGSRDALLAGIKEAGGSEGMANAKKGEMVQHLAAIAKDRAWTPKLLATLPDVLPKVPAPAAPEKPSRAEIAAERAARPPGQYPEDADRPPTGGDDDPPLDPKLVALAGGGKPSPIKGDDAED